MLESSYSTKIFLSTNFLCEYIVLDTEDNKRNTCSCLQRFPNKSDMSTDSKEDLK